MELSIYSGKPRKVVQRILQDGKNVKDAVLTVLDKMVASISGQPGFFNGRLTYLSSLSGKKEIFLSDALMSTASPQTAFGKITFLIQAGTIQALGFSSPVTVRFLIISII